MSQRGSGLRNRFRQGTGTYSTSGKGRTADSYGEYNQGRCIREDMIASHRINATENDDLKVQVERDRRLAGGT